MTDEEVYKLADEMYNEDPGKYNGLGDAIHEATRIYAADEMNNKQYEKLAKYEKQVFKQEEGIKREAQISNAVNEILYDKEKKRGKPFTSDEFRTEMVKLFKLFEGSADYETHVATYIESQKKQPIKSRGVK